MARYWAAFSTDAEPEGSYFRRFIEGGGEPALDAGCGTGRLIIPWLHAGLDVDGCDVSPDMIALCRERAEREGLAPALYVQPMHQLDLPRRYRTIVACGALGVGSSREQDEQALTRLREHLEPGGTLVLDNEAPYASSRNWRYWLKENRGGLPLDWHPWGERQRGSDGAEYRLRTRLLDVDPLSQSVRAEIEAQMWRDGELVAEERSPIDLMAYFKDELVMMIERAGFHGVEVRGGYQDEAPTPDHDFLVYIAHAPD